MALLVVHLQARRECQPVCGVRIAALLVPDMPLKTVGSACFVQKTRCNIVQFDDTAG